MVDRATKTVQDVESGKLDPLEASITLSETIQKSLEAKKKISRLVCSKIENHKKEFKNSKGKSFVFHKLSETSYILERLD